MIKEIVFSLMILVYSQILFAQAEDQAKTFSSFFSIPLFKLPKDIKDLDEKMNKKLEDLDKQNKLLSQVIKEHHVFQGKIFNDINKKLDDLQEGQKITNEKILDVIKTQDVQNRKLDDIIKILTTDEFNVAMRRLEDLKHLQDENRKQKNLEAIVDLLRESASKEKTPFKLLMTYLIISECIMQYIPAEPQLAEEYLMKIIGIPRPTDIQEKSIALLQYKIKKNTEEAENDPLPIREEISLVNKKYEDISNVLTTQKSFFADQEEIFIEYQEKVYATLSEKYKKSTEVDAAKKIERIEQMRNNSIKNISEESPIIEEYIKIIKKELNHK